MFRGVAKMAREMAAEMFSRTDHRVAARVVHAQQLRSVDAFKAGAKYARIQTAALIHDIILSDQSRFPDFVKLARLLDSQNDKPSVVTDFDIDSFADCYAENHVQPVKGENMASRGERP